MYEWHDGSVDPIFEVSQTGSYSVTVTSENCTGTDEIEITYFPIPIFELGEQQTICHSSGFQLEVITEVPDANILWNTGLTNPILEPQSSGVYEATATANGCDFSDTIEIEVIQQLSFDFGEDRIACKGDTLVLNASTNGFDHPVSYVWSDGSTDSTFTAMNTGEYSVTMESECDVVSDAIAVYFEQCGCLLYVPNAFTPDQDGLNDVFSVSAKCDFDTYKIIIFNRFGQEVYRSYQPDSLWDGSHQGGDYFVADGVYVYRIEYTTNTLEGVVSEVLSGHITVLR